MTIYYVKPTGNDGNDGLSEGNAWLTISYAVSYSSLAAGDTIRVLSGTYAERVLINSKSGTSGNPITVIAYDGPGSVTIDGSYTLPTGTYVSGTTATFNNHSGGTTAGLGYVWGGLVMFQNVQDWIFDGFIVYRSRGRGLSIDTCTRISTRNVTINGARNAGWHTHTSIDSEFLTGEVVDAANFAPVSRSSGEMNWPVIVNMINSDGITIRDVTIHESWGEGIATGRDSQNIIIEDCFIYDNYALNVYVHYGLNTDIRRNVVWHTSSNTFNRGANPSADIVLNMESQNFPTSIPADNHFIYNNLIITRSEGINIWNNQGGGATSGNIRIYNNTVIASPEGAALSSITTGSSHSDTRVRNNIFVKPSGGSPFSGSTITQNFTFSNNIWSSAPPSAMQGSGDIIGNPAFVNAVTTFSSGSSPGPANYKKLLGSIGIDAGTNALYSATDYFGTTRNTTNPDIGFDEYSSAGGAPTDYYVSLGGNNTDGLSLATAWDELDQIDWAGSIVAGDTIHIEGGTYTTSLNPTVSGTQADPIFIRTTGGAVIIRGARGTTLLPEAGTLSITPDSSSEYGVEIDVDYIDIDGGDWKNILIEGWKGHGIFLRKNSTGCKFRNIEIRNCGWLEERSSWTGGGINYSGDPAAYPNGAGIRLGGNGHKFFRIICHDNGQDAIQSADGDDNALDDIEFTRCWLYNARPHTIANASPIGGANTESFNYASHTDGIQVYSGGTVNNITMTNCLVGPGLTNGLILGQTGAGGSDLVSNGDFEASPYNTDWSYSGSGSISEQSYTPSGTGSSVRCSPAASPNDMIFYQDNISIVNTTEYTFSFYMNSNVSSTSVKVYLHDPGAGFGTHYGISAQTFTVPSAASWTLMSYVFNATATVSDARLSFEIGAYVASPTFVRFDDISLIGSGAGNTQVQNLLLDNVLLFGCQDSTILGYTGVSNDNWTIRGCTFHSTNTKDHLIQMDGGANLVIQNSVFDGGPSTPDINILTSNEPTTVSNNYQVRAGSSDTIGTVLLDEEQIFKTIGTNTFDLNNYTIIHNQVQNAGSTGTVAAMLEVGGVTGPDSYGTYTFTNSSNLVINGDFENDLSNWIHFDGGTNGTIETASGANSTATSAKITCSSNSNIQLYQTPISITNGTQYKLSFYAYSSAGRDMTVRLIQHASPFTNYGLNKSVNLGTAWSYHEMVFTATATSTAARLTFLIGGFSQSGDIYYIDEVELIPFTATPYTGRAVQIGMNLGAKIGVN